MAHHRHKAYCEYACLDFVGTLPEKKALITNVTKDLTYVEKSTVINALRIQKGGRPAYFYKQINQFGREVGTGGRGPSNFR